MGGGVSRPLDFSSVGITQRSQRIRIKLEHRHFTALSVPGGEYRVLSGSQQNGPASEDARAVPNRVRPALDSTISSHCILPEQEGF